MKASTQKILFFTSLIFVLSLFYFQVTSAAGSPPNLRAQITGNIDAGNSVAGLGNAAPQEIVARVIQIILSIVGITFTALIVLSGYNILSAGGDEGKVEKAKKTIQACVIGLAITLGAYSITTFLGKSAVEITNKNMAEPVDTRLDYDRLKNDIMNAGSDVGNNSDASGSSL